MEKTLEELTTLMLEYKEDLELAYNDIETDIHDFINDNIENEYLAIDLENLEMYLETVKKISENIRKLL